MHKGIEENEASINSIGTYALTDDKQTIYNADIARQQFYTPQSNNITIDAKSGNLQYQRRDVEIPLESGYMTLDLVYSVDDAIAAEYYYEEVADGDRLYTSISHAPEYIGQEPKLARSIDYDAYGNILSDTDANGNTVTIENDIFGRQTSVKYEQDSNAIRAYYYDVFFDGDQKCSAVIKIDQTNKASIQYYDLLGQNYKNAIIKNMTSLSSVDWNNIAQLPSNTQLVITQTNEFDDLGRVIKTCDGESRPVTYEYDILGNITKQITGNTNDTPLKVEYTYDSMGNVLTMNQAGHVTTHEYDKAGRLVKTTDPMGFTETYQYDKNSNIIKSVDKNGETCTNVYDSMNRLIKTTKNGESKEYEYEKTHGNVISQKDSSGTINYSYNTIGTLASKTYPDGKKISYTEYDANKNLLSITDYFGNVTNYEYDGKNRITSIAEKYKGTNEYKTTTYQYNENGSLARVNIPNNMTTYYTYDYAGRVSYLNNTSIHVDTCTQFNYTYDNSGNITAVTQNIENQTSTKTYVYDSANRLSYERGSGSYYGYYSYDEHNNLRAIAGSERDEYYTYDANNRLTDLRVEGIYTDPETGDEYTDWRMFYDYDNNGSLLSATYYLDPDYCPTKTYQYNAWGEAKNWYDYYTDFNPMN